MILMLTVYCMFLLKDTATGKEQKVKVEASSGLSKEEVDKMVTEAEAKSEEDKQRHEAVEKRNKLG